MCSNKTRYLLKKKIKATAITTTIKINVTFGVPASCACVAADGPTDTPFDVATTALPERSPAVDTPHFPIALKMEAVFPAPPSPQQQQEFWHTPGVGFTVDIPRQQVIAILRVLRKSGKPKFR
jgi:hypothetical protein